MSRLVALPPAPKATFPGVVVDVVADRGTVGALEWLERCATDLERLGWSLLLAVDLRRAACFFAEVHA